MVSPSMTASVLSPECTMKPKESITPSQETMVLVGPASDAMVTSFPIMFSRMLRAANSVRCRTEFPSLSKLNDSTTPPVKVPGIRRISSLGMLPDSAFWNVAGVSALHKAVATAS
jgi:hypothetical protein